MNQITASVHVVHEDGERGLETRYSAECGCGWVVDMKGNVRKVNVCYKCMHVPRALEGQLTLPLAADE